MKPEVFMDMMNQLPDDMLVSAYKNRFAQHTETKAVFQTAFVSEQPAAEKRIEKSSHTPPRWMTAATLAACMLFAVGSGILLLSGKHDAAYSSEASDDAAYTGESSVSIQENPDIEIQSGVPDFSDSEEGENFFSGHGVIRPVTAGELNIFQDDEYYYHSGSRIPKSAITGNEKLADLFEGYSQERCDINDLIGNGQDLYYVDLTTESLWEGHAGGLKRILPDGTIENLHPQNKITADNQDSIACRVYYKDVLRLGDSGIYFVNGCYMSSIDAEACDVYPEPILLDSRTGETTALDLSTYFDPIFFNEYHAEYDEASGHLFMSVIPSESSILEIDIHTGAIVYEYPAWEHGGSRGDWFVRDHVLHFLGTDPDNYHQVNWYTHDMNTSETKVLLADCKLVTFAYCDGKVYAGRHATVGNDSLLSFAPDGTNETLLGEIHNPINDILPIFDPDSIVLTADHGSCFMFRQETGFSRIW